MRRDDVTQCSAVSGADRMGSPAYNEAGTPRTWCQGVPYLTLVPAQLVAVLREVKYLNFQQQKAIPSNAESLFSENETFRKFVGNLELIVGWYNEVGGTCSARLPALCQGAGCGQVPASMATLASPGSYCPRRHWALQSWQPSNARGHTPCSSSLPVGMGDLTGGQTGSLSVGKPRVRYL